MDENATCVEDQLPEFAERLNQACSVIKDLKLAARFRQKLQQTGK